MSEFQFNRLGRVDYMLSRRLQLLDDVLKVAKSITSTIQVDEACSYSCESALIFEKNIINPLWEQFLKNCISDGSADSVSIHFPFTNYFLQKKKAANSKETELFTNKDVKEDMRRAETYYAIIRKIFEEINDVHPFELLRNSYDRTNHLLIKQAKIVAMTSTHAALKRNDYVKLSYYYDNIIIEESSQLLDIEAFISIMTRFQNRQNEKQLQRIVLIGDHNQLPPVVKQLHLQKFSNFNQSLFTRFVRLGIPTIDLDRQGRCRGSLANLFNWKYKFLSNLPFTESDATFVSANPGLRYDYQVVNVEDYNSVGEYEPSPHFFQNLGEAEYLVCFYQFLRILGYPASKISVITTYNGQKQLLRDVFSQRCSNFYGFPHKITTVDRYQGQQNDSTLNFLFLQFEHHPYFLLLVILLSLVRTKNVGHIRDVRRLIVAVSRARLGLYVFCRTSLFGNCHELAPTFSQLLSRPTNLHLVENEKYPKTNRKVLFFPFL